MVYRDVPLFPLDTVLFPQMVLPLQIFEPRYLEMISECVRNHAPFGVVLIKEGQQVGEPATPFTTGTLAKISEVLKLKDGRLLITTVGTERFRLLDYHTVKPYMTGDIETWPEEKTDVTTDEPELVKQVQAKFKTYLQILSELARKRIEGLEVPNDPAGLSYVIPNWLLQIELIEKQRLLEIGNYVERLREEDRLLQRETEFLYRIKEQSDEANSSGETDTRRANEFSDYTPTFPFSKN